MSGGGEEDVSSFDVSVDLAVFVNVLQSEDSFVQDVGDVLFHVDFVYGFCGDFDGWVACSLNFILFQVHGVVQYPGRLETVEGTSLIHELHYEP